MKTFNDWAAEKAHDREMQRIIDSCTCSECGAGLINPLDPTTGKTTVKCSKDALHKGYIKQASWAEAYRRGEAIPIHIANRIEKKIGGARMESKAIVKLTEDQMLSRIEKAKFPVELTLSEKKLLARAGLDYGFDPLMGELTIYQGQPYVSLAGRYRKALETGELDGVISRPATMEEYQAWRIPEGDYFFQVEVRKKGCAYPFVGWGRVREAEVAAARSGRGKDFLPLATNPQQMAEKRAQAQALKKAFFIPFPSFEDIVENVVFEADSMSNAAPPKPATPQPAVPKDAPYGICPTHNVPLRKRNDGSLYCAIPTVKGANGRVIGWCKYQPPKETPPPYKSSVTSFPTDPKLYHPEYPVDVKTAFNFYFRASEEALLRLLEVEKLDDITDVEGAWAFILEDRKA